VDTENPLIRSGLVLAGAQVFGLPGADLRTGDGVLTALEAGDLDLTGTRLVVLSACETAVGELRAGDGVQGLRRTLAIAGAETIVTSLWKVDDAATRDLVVRAYGALRAGVGRTEAFRQAQLQALAAPATKHPHYWAAFVVAGQHGPAAKDTFGAGK
jgi:CHAT domain-containing protein